MNGERENEREKEDGEELERVIRWVGSWSLMQ